MDVIAALTEALRHLDDAQDELEAAAVYLEGADRPAMARVCRRSLQDAKVAAWPLDWLRANV